MSHLDPYAGPGPRGWERRDEPRGWERRDEPRGWEQPGGSAGWQWPANGDEHEFRARQAAAAPETYQPYQGRDPGFAADDTVVYRSRPESGGLYGRPRHDHDDRHDDHPHDGHADQSAQEQPAAAIVGHNGTYPVDPEPQPPRGWRRPPGRRRAKNRAGRNLPAAIAVGVLLAAAILVPLFTFRPAFFAIVAIAVTVGIWEMARAVRAAGAQPPILPLAAGGLLMTGLAWLAGPDGLSLGLLITMLATLMWRLADGPVGYQRDVVAAALIAVYIPFLAGFAVLLAVPEDGDWRVVATLAAVVLSDTAGYAVGVLFGRHPMAPKVSPKKSWEGFGGSLAGAGIGSAVLLYVAFDVALWWGLLFGLAISVVSVLGDLTESLLKRDLGIKDMSNLLPGHGGLMDRLDSILFAVPTAYLLLSVFLAPA